MTDDQLSHLCRLATVAVGYIRCDEFEADIALGVERHGETVRNTVNIYRILADAFFELAKRQGMTPTFRLPAHSQPVEAASGPVSADITRGRG